jgi:hypothetical protein
LNHDKKYTILEKSVAVSENGMTNKIYLFIAVCISLTCACCGYHFSPGGEDIDPSIQSIYVDKFLNSTSEAYVETFLRNSLIEQFRRSKRFSISKNEKEADALVSGAITTIQTFHVSYSETNIAKEDEIYMALDIRFYTDEGRTIWRNQNLTGKEVYIIGNDPAFSQRNKERALRKLSEDLAEKAYRNMMSGF